MGTRKRVSKKKDRKIFKTAADSTKSINIKPNVARGGIRL